MILALAVLVGVVAVIGCEMDMGVIALVVVVLTALFVMARADRRDGEAIENAIEWWSKNGKGHNE